MYLPGTFATGKWNKIAAPTPTHEHALRSELAPVNLLVIKTSVCKQMHLGIVAVVTN